MTARDTIEELAKEKYKGKWNDESRQKLLIPYIAEKGVAVKSLDEELLFSVMTMNKWNY